MQTRLSAGFAEWAGAAAAQLEGGKRLKKDLMPDALHPNGVGMQALADCIHDSLQLAIPNLPVTKSA